VAGVFRVVGAVSHVVYGEFVGERAARLAQARWGAWPGAEVLVVVVSAAALGVSAAELEAAAREA
jgi:hypothetical protein